MASIASNLSSLKKEAIDDTLALNKGEILAGCCQPAGSSRNHPSLRRQQQPPQCPGICPANVIQQDVRIHQLQGEIMFNAYFATKQSCAIIISYSGETHQLIQIMAFLKRKGIPMILLTSIGDNSSTSLATHVLRLATREKLYSRLAASQPIPPSLSSWSASMLVSLPRTLRETWPSARTPPNSSSLTEAPAQKS